MGKINVKGIRGVVEIEGDKPTQQEANDIKKSTYYFKCRRY